MPEGVIVGGWEFVIAAYGVTVVGLAAYGLGLWLRLRRAGAAEESTGREEQA